MTHRFDRATALVEDEPGRFIGAFDDNWSIAGVPNGGLSMGIVLRGALTVTGAADPITMTSHFLSAAAPGPFALDIEVVKSGRRLSTVSAAISQEGRERVRSLVTLGDLSALSGPDVGRLPPPEIDAVPAGSSVGPDFRRMAERFDFQVPAGSSWAASEPSGVPKVRGRIRFSDGREPDLLSAPILLDSFPPTTFQLSAIGWSPTLEMTVHFRARPAPGRCTGELEARVISSGLFEEDGVLWDSTGTVVAMSRQLAMVAS